MMRLYLSKTIVSILNKCMNPQLMIIKFNVSTLKLMHATTSNHISADECS